MREEAEVISGPNRKTPMAAEQKPEQDKELAEIRREVIEARNLVIKTDNLLKNLHAEVKSIGKRHEDFQRRQWISSGVAYALFAVLSVGGAFLLVSSSSSNATEERARLQKKVDELSGELEKLRADAAAVQSAQRVASDVYKMMTTLPGDDRLKGIDALVKLDTSRLTALERQALNDRAVLLRKEIGDAAFERGKTAYRRNDMATIISELSRFVVMNPPEPELVEASFYLGVAYNQTRQHEQAVPLLARFVEGDRKARQRDYAMLLLAQSYQETNQLDKAEATARDALATYPASDFLPQFRGRLSSIRRATTGTTGTAASAPAQPAAAAPPAAEQPAAAQPPQPLPLQPVPQATPTP
jgi:TolA-binding protein